ncbi:MAG: VWA-like domain-containing protein [Lachnospiraceae bacterium]|nr:VWA-like domain-containing protein [Lachnospiraceae bacterium]
MSILYDEQARELAFAEVAQDILRGAQNELYLNMRFLDVALSSLALLPDGQIRPAGTDGTVFYFRPDSLAELFRKGRESVNRLYLHSILHCLFAHLWERNPVEAFSVQPGFAPDDPSRDGQRSHTGSHIGSYIGSHIGTVADDTGHGNTVRRSSVKDKEYWNLACDIAVEYIIDGLYIRAVHRPMSALRRGFYRALEEDAAASGSRPALTAQRIYRYLCRIHPVQAKLDQLKWEFAVDDHSRWVQDSASPPNALDSQMKNRSQKEADDKNSKETNDTGDTPDTAQNQLPTPDQNKTRQEQQAPDASDVQKKWEDIRDRMQTELETFGKNNSDDVKALEEQICAANRKRYDYRDFLRKFSVLKEEMQVDIDSFDYIYYHYGMDVYGNMPLIEPLETKEVKKIEDFVIVLDTSMSCQGDLLLHFLEETYSILSESESFFRKIHIHILQCDDRVQEDVLITNQKEMQEYLEHFTVRGFGGTDFRPPFARVSELMRRQCFTKLRGLIYFTDGYGTFPVKKPPYDTAFVFLREDYRDLDVPPWAIKLIVDEEDLRS